MDKNIFGYILGGDKAKAANVIEKLYHSPPFPHLLVPMRLAVPV